MLFFVVNHGVTGLYMGSVFAPNHKGMPVLEKDELMGFMRQQIITTRNLKPHPITDFVYGGLNYHIEHHLFPNMPRNNLKKARVVVREFCRTHSLPYYETSVLQSQREILGYLHKTGRRILTPELSANWNQCWCSLAAASALAMNSSGQLLNST